MDDKKMMREFWIHGLLGVLFVSAIVGFWCYHTGHQTGHHEGSMKELKKCRVESEKDLYRYYGIGD